jgi:hypothetical protein
VDEEDRRCASASERDELVGTASLDPNGLAHRRWGRGAR